MDECVLEGGVRGKIIFYALWNRLKFRIHKKRDTNTHKHPNNIYV